MLAEDDFLLCINVLSQSGSRTCVELLPFTRPPAPPSFLQYNVTVLLMWDCKGGWNRIYSQLHSPTRTHRINHSAHTSVCAFRHGDCLTPHSSFVWSNSWQEGTLMENQIQTLAYTQLPARTACQQLSDSCKHLAYHKVKKSRQLSSNKRLKSAENNTIHLNLQWPRDD